ncbi:hypothetical protein ACIQ1H_09325 [Lysinibacillus sp. NPDC097279]|uniref:hypothetical protein n=1 Tax=Lysinibacillus sp. NPDC097279 TaxID=3364143 RepID=UPI0037FAD183
MFDTLMKHAKHFTNLEHLKASAHVVHIDENGHLFMTDSIIGVLAKDVCPENPIRTIALDGKPSKVPVFKYSQFFGYEIVETIELDVKEMLLLTQGLEAVKKVEGASSLGAIRFEIEDDQYKIFYQGIEFTSTYDLMDKKPNQNEVNIRFDVSLLTKAFKLLKDLGIQTCNIQFVNSMRPCYFSSDDERVRIVVMPCRSY